MQALDRTEMTGAMKKMRFAFELIANGREVTVKSLTMRDGSLLGMRAGKRSVGQVRDFSLLPRLRPRWRGGILKKFLVFFGDFHQTDSHAKGVFLFIDAIHVSPHDLTGETYGLTIWRDDGHAEIFVHAEGFIASHIDSAQGDVSYLALNGAVL